MINLFLDSHIWLDLYSFSNDDLNQFSKLHDMIGSDLRVFLTQQVKDEIDRNRDNKINEAMTSFSKVNIQFPNLCKGYEQYKSLETIYKSFKTKRNELMRLVMSDIEKRELHADKVIARIFSKIDIIDISEKIIHSSVLRYKLGNPPGKENSYGDAINWESLLEFVPDKEDLFFISYDRDFRSPLADKKINSFLQKEWNEKKKSEIFFYTSLTMFLNEHIKDISLKAENIKNSLIEELRKSGSFAATHSIVKRLNEYESWTEDQCLYLFEAAESNNQVYGIIQDDDLKDFYTRLYSSCKAKIQEKEDHHWLLKKLDIEVTKNEEDDVPF